MDKIEILGLFAAFFTTASYLPQAIKTIRTKETATLSLWMYIFLCMGGSLWIIYGVFSESLPVIIANSISLLFSIIIMVFKIIYK